MDTKDTNEICKDLLLTLEAPDYGNVLNLVQEVIETVEND